MRESSMAPYLNPPVCDCSRNWPLVILQDMDYFKEFPNTWSFCYFVTGGIRQHRRQKLGGLRCTGAAEFCGTTCINNLRHSSDMVVVPMSRSEEHTSEL